MIMQKLLGGGGLLTFEEACLEKTVGFRSWCLKHGWNVRKRIVQSDRVIYESCEQVALVSERNVRGTNETQRSSPRE